MFCNVIFTADSVNPNSWLVGPRSITVTTRISGRKTLRKSQVPTETRPTSISPAMIAAMMGCSNIGAVALSLGGYSLIILARNANMFGRLRSLTRTRTSALHLRIAPSSLQSEQHQNNEGFSGKVAVNPSTTLADLYDPDLMPPNLRRAHQALDRAVDRLYRRTGFYLRARACRAFVRAL